MFKAKMLDQLDEEFGIGNLVKEEIHTARNTAYTAKDLKGLQVEHNIVSIIYSLLFTTFLQVRVSHIFLPLNLQYIYNEKYLYFVGNV